MELNQDQDQHAHTRSTSEPVSVPQITRKRGASLRQGYQEGVWAVLLALIPTLLVTLLFRLPNPLNPLVERVMEWTPVDVAVIMLDVLGIWAKPLALWGGFAIAMVLGGVAGALYPLRAWEREQAGYIQVALRAGILAALAAGSFALLVRPRSVVTMLVLYGCTLALIHFFQSRTTKRIAVQSSRRAFVRESAATLGIILVLSSLSIGDMLLRQFQGIGRTTRKLFEWEPPLPRNPEIAAITGITPEVTSIDEFYIMSKNLEDPVSSFGVDDAVADGSWTLEISGHVERPLTLSMNDILRMPRTDQYVTMQCISNTIGGKLMSTALFSGVPLARILERAGVKPNAVKVAFSAPDEHHDSLSIEDAMRDDVLLAYAMNGETLSFDHGYPLRLHIPGIYGFKNVKWLTRIVVFESDYLGHWQQRGWTDSAIIHVTSRIDVIQPQGDKLLLAGIAFGGNSGISKVEVRRQDGGEWTPVILHAPAIGHSTWVQWSGSLPFVPGESRYQVRAFDAAGKPQLERNSIQFPDGATGLHSVYVKF